MVIQIVPLQAHHRAAWQPLAEGYKAFYRTPTTMPEYDLAWARILAAQQVHGLGAFQDGQLVGVAHFLYHASTWTERVCYLQDLYTHESARGRGVARGLIEAVADRARQAGATRYYWLTQESNAVARALYDKVARHNGFIRYDGRLGGDG
ncbi:MAG: GNAT family N-acetyltransferase [Burkholderiaceae bacterium]|nr:GNAT family N-acetyltransferase [Burkholderiaceae bacterium]